MSRELLLLRHGKSDWGVDVDDFHRPLTKRGVHDAQRIGVWLQRENVVPDYILSSPAVRAIKTTEKCVKVFGINPQNINCDMRAYHASLEELLRLLAHIPSNIPRVMLVGHNPGLEELLCYLVDGPLPPHADGKILPTGTLAHLTLPHFWSSLMRGEAALNSIVRGKDLPPRYPFPSEKRVQEREKPAYYYRQSAAVPFRFHGGRMEVLLVGTGKKYRNPGIPKGIVEPGLSAKDSAAKEALEEGGVLGNIDESPCGSFRYRKWGSYCKVEVFALEVTAQLPDAEWLEPYRGRQWLSVAEAKAKIKQKKLVPLLEQLSKRKT